MRRCAHVLLVTVALVSTTTSASPQQVFRAGVDVVSLDVTVLDKAGHPVPGLTAADFTVTIGDKRSAIKAIDYVDWATAPGGIPVLLPGGLTFDPGKEPVGTPLAGRSILIGVDDVSFRGLDAQRTTGDIADWLTKLNESDTVAVMTTSGRVFAPFTRDRKTIAAALKEAGVGQAPATHATGSRLSLREAEVIDENVGHDYGTFNQGAVPEEARESYQRECLGDPQPINCFRQWRDTAEEVARSVAQMRALSGEAYRSFLNTLRSAPGPRVLLCVSNGIPIDDRMQIRNTIADAESVGAQAFILTPETTAASTASDPSHTFTITDANGNGMLLPGAKSYAAMRREDDEFVKAGLDRLADETGARVFRFTTSAAPALATVVNNIAGFYRLGIELPADLKKPDGAPIKIHVSRTGTTTVSATRLPSAIAAVVSAVASAANSPAPATAPVASIPLTVGARLQRGDSGDVRIIVGTDVPASLTGTMKVRIDVTTALGWANKSAEGQITAPDGQPATGTFALNVQPGAYHLRVTATDATGHVAASERDVTAQLPSFGSIPVSDVVLAWAGADHVVHGWSLERVPPAATSVSAAIELYPADPAAALPELELSVINAEGREVLSRILTPKAVGSKQIAGTDIAMADLQKGRHEIRIEANSGDKSLGVAKTTILIP